jgi:hypothetical protein
MKTLLEGNYDAVLSDVNVEEGTFTIATPGATGSEQEGGIHETTFYKGLDEFDAREMKKYEDCEVVVRFTIEAHRRKAKKATK